MQSLVARVPYASSMFAEVCLSVCLCLCLTQFHLSAFVIILRLVLVQMTKPLRFDGQPLYSVTGQSAREKDTGKKNEILNGLRTERNNSTAIATVTAVETSKFKVENAPVMWSGAAF